MELTINQKIFAYCRIAEWLDFSINLTKKISDLGLKEAFMILWNNNPKFKHLCDRSLGPSFFFKTNYPLSEII